MFCIYCIRVSQKFCLVLIYASLRHVYYVKQWKEFAGVHSITVVGVLTSCAVLHSVFNLKASKMNMQFSLIQEFMFYDFEQDHDTMEATEKIWYQNGVISSFGGWSSLEVNMGWRAGHYRKFSAIVEYHSGKLV